MAGSDLKPFDGQLDSPSQNLTPFTGELDPPEAPKRTALDVAKDIGVTALKGAVGLPQSVVGLADIATGGRAGKALEEAGLRFEDTQKILNEQYSDAQKAANRKVQEADGFVDTAKAMVQNPSTIATSVGESIPQMLGGAGVARGVLKFAPKVGAALAGALGEGVLGAGSAAEQIRQETQDGLVTPTQAALAAATGVATTAFGAAGGKLAQRLDIGDADTMLAQGAIRGSAPAPARSLARQVGEGIISEGVLEEVPQSMAEQALQNLALDKPVGEGVGAAAAQGLLAGGAMGGGAALLHGAGGHAPAAAASTAEQPAAEAALRLENTPPSRLISYPNGSVGGVGEVESYPENLPEDQRLVELARLMGLAPQPADAPGARAVASEAAPLESPAAAPVAPAPSQQMGLNAADGPLSAAAVTAVDGGAHQDMLTRQAAAVAQEQAQDAAKGKKADAPAPAAAAVDAETGEMDRAAELQSRLDFVRQQAAANGWDQRLIAERNRAHAELQTLTAGATPTTAPAAPANVQEGIAQAHARRTSPATDAKTVGEAAAASAVATTDSATRPVATEARAPVVQTQGEARGPQAHQAQQAGAQQAPAGPETSAAPAELTAAPAAPAVPKAKHEKAFRRVDEGRAWFLSNDKAQAFVQESGLADTHEVVPDNRRFIVRAKASNELVQPQGGEDAAAARGVRVADVGASGAAGIAQDAAGQPLRSAQPADGAGPRDGDPGRTASAVRAAVSDATGAGEQQPALSTAPAAQAAAAVDTAANEAATSSQNDLPEPSQAQKEAGNYKLGHLSGAEVQGLRISVENPQGSTRSGTSPDGRAWSNTMAAHYGYVKGSEAADGDHVDVFVGPHAATAPTVYVVDQINPNGTYDEAKALFGFNTEADAAAAYKGSYDADWKVGPITAMSVDEFKAGLASGRFKKPLSQSLQRGASAQAAQDQGAERWRELTPAGRRDAMQRAGVKLPDQVLWEHISEANREKLRSAVGMVQEAATAAAPGAAPADQESVQAPATQFAGNKLFTADKVAAARERMKSKLGRLNSGIDPELLVDGMTIAGAYIESGARNFTQFARSMIEDMGEGVKPYLLSFWEGARNFPGLDTKGMTDPAESARQHAALLAPADRAGEAVGEVATKPAARSKKSGAKGDMVLTQDWGVEHINGYGDSAREEGNDTKDAFLKESRAYLNAAADALRAFGYEPHLDRKGNPEKPVSVNQGGAAGSGDVALTMRNPETGHNAYIHVGDTALRGVAPSTPSGIAVMYRVAPGADRYAARGGNIWAPVDLSAKDLAAMVAGAARPVAATKTGDENGRNAGAVPPGRLPGADQGGAAVDAGPRNRDRQPVDDGLAQARTGADGGERVSAGPAPAGGSRADGVQRPRESTSGEARDSRPVRTERQPADAVADPATAESSPKPELDQPTDHTLDAEDVGKGGLTKKYRDNIAAIRILKALTADGRKATPDERKQIARYVGWGALKGAFDPQNKQWAAEFAELRDLLTDAEYKAARASTLNAHYTAPAVVDGIYQVLQRLGFTSGRVLEPSVGTGNFFGLMPAPMRKQSQLHGVELDPLTSQIAAALYPSAKIAHATGFQEFQAPAEYFDLAVGNPPFGSEPIVDDDRSPYSGFSIHNYFFAKSIDKLRSGGLLAMVVSHNFLDAKTDTARRWIAERADLVAAVRLPRTAFKENAGTEVVTDIVVFQKRAAGDAAAPASSDWVKTGQQALTEAKSGQSTQHTVSSYFLANPDAVLGTPTAAGSMYRLGEYTVEPNGNLSEQLKAWADRLPQGIFQPVERTHEQERADVEVPDGVKVGSYYVDGKGGILMRGPDSLGNRTAEPWTPPNAKAVERVTGMIGLRDALRAQMRLERSTDATEEQIEVHRRELNRLYDAFQAKNGYLNDPTNRRLFLDDTESALVLALEFDYDRGVSKAVAEREDIEARPPKAAKADIFNRRVMFPPADNIKVSSAKDALLASLNYKGRLDLDYMAGLYDKPATEIAAELGDVVYTDPVRGLVMADEYLSGDVKTKLQEAEAAARDNPALRRNVEALRKVIPADKRPSEIHAAMGASFIPQELFQQFAKEVTGADARVTYLRATGQWLVEFTGQANPALNTAKWGITKMPAQSIFMRTMAGQGVVVTETHRGSDGSTTTVVLEKETEAAREKQAALKAEWQRWLWSDPERADRVAGIYNDKMNRVVVRKFDGSHMTFPGMSPALELLPHQKDAVWRALQDRQILLDHVVGAGKTFEVVASIMEMRRLGIARKPIVAVPNHLTLQWRSEFSRLYPAANVLAATPDDFAKGNREKFFSKIVTGDWDAVIVGHSSLKKIALPPETEKAVLEEQITEISGAIEDMKRARGDRSIVRDMEGIKARLEARMKQRIQALGDRDKVVTFDELGVDAFAVDELHEFKNLFYNSTMERVPGMGNPGGSDKAFDLFVKMQYLFEALGDKAPIMGATGTPVSNSLVEMFNMQRFLQYPALKAQGLNVFDAWAKQFGSVESLYEVSPSGTGYRQASRFAKFKNLLALMSMYQTFADTVTLDDLKSQGEARGEEYPVPNIAGGRPANVVAKRSPLVANFMGVPQLDIEGGKVRFGFNPAAGERATITQSEDGNTWRVEIGAPQPDGKEIRTLLGSAKTEEDAKLLVVEAALSPKIKVDPKSILGQFANLKQLNKETKGKVNALSLTGQANKAGLDYRLIDPAAPDFEGSKINLAVERMADTYQKWAADKGTQLVFCDLSVPLSARSGFGAKERRVYVREDGALVHKKGTMHTVRGFEDLPFFVVKESGKTGKAFSVYDAATGLRVHSGLPAKGIATDWAAQTMADAARRQRWIDARDRVGDIQQDEIDDYNNVNEIDTEESESITQADIAGMSGATAFSVYDDIKGKLIARGVPEREIAFIYDYNTPAAKDKLFKAVNAGSIRFLLGSTPKMGAGTNVQQRLVGLHHIDAPWRPSDLEQREGRIIRRGNLLRDRDPEGFEVEIYRYATEQTYDTRRWQILEHKARGIEQLRNYDGTLNEIDDIEGEAANAADMKAAASGDPLILEETQLRNDVRRLESLQASHADETSAMVRRARDQQRFADEFGPQELDTFRRLQAAAEAHPIAKDTFPGLLASGKAFADREEAIKAVKRGIDRIWIGDGREVFEYRGVEFTLERVGNHVDLSSPTGALESYRPEHDVLPSAAGFITRFGNYVNRIPAHIADLAAKIEEAKRAAVDLREQAGKPFAQAQELDAAREAHRRVQRRLVAKGPDIPQSQRPVLAKAMAEQRKQLGEQGFAEALEEFGGSVADDTQFRRVDDGLEGMSPAVANAMRALSRANYSPEARAQAVASVQRTVDTIRAAWSGGPQVVVAFDMADPAVPAAARRADLKQRSGGARGAPEGFYYRGKAYLMASRLATPNDAARVLFHEVLGHHGLRGQFGKGLDGVLNQIITMRRAEVDAKIKEYGLRGVNRLDRRAAAEEVLAEMAQTRPDLPFVRRAIAAIRTWLRENVPGFKNLRMTDDEIIRNFILPARAFVERASGAPGADGAPVMAFSRSADTRTAFEVRIDALYSGDKPKPQGVRILDRSDVLGLLGMSEGPVHLVESKVEQGRFNHGLTAADWKKVPAWLENPAAVFGSETSPGRLVFIGPELVRGVPVRMIVDPRPDGDGVNLLINAYEAERNPFERWERDGLLRYFDRQKATPVTGSFQPRLAGLPGDRGRHKILTDKHLAGYRRANPDADSSGAPDDGDIRFSRSTVQGFTQRATTELNKTFSAPGKLSWWHKTVGTMYNLAERSPAFKAVFDSAQGFVDDVSYYANDAAELAPKLLPKLETWRDIKKAPVSAADNKAVAKPVFEGTLSWARDESGKAVPVQSLIDAAGALTADQKAQRLLGNGHLAEQMLKAWKGMPLESYEKAINSRFESKMLQPGVVWTAAELRSMFSLSDDQIALYREFRETTDRSLDTMARADMLRFVGDDAKGLRDMVMDAPDAQAAATMLRDHLVQLADDQPDRATMLLNTANGVIDRADKVRDLQARGYAPLSRFGRYTVDVVDAQGERQYFGLFETMREANQMAARMKEEFGEGAVSQGTLSEEAFKLFAGVTPETLELFGNALGLDSTGDGAQDQAFQEYLRLTKTNRSAMRRLIHRKGIAGFSDDVGRVLAAFVYSNARQTAAGLHMGDLGEAVTAIPKEQGELKDAAVRLAEYVKNPQEEAQAIRGLLFAQYLGGSVASAFVNMSQPVAVTFPWLSQYGGAKAAAAQLGRAAKDLANRGRDIEPDLAAALKRAEAEGVVAPQEVHQLMAQARGAGSLQSWDGTRAGDLQAMGQNALSRLSLAWGKVFGAAEQVNRRLTFIAAYRTAKAQGMADPAGFASKAITETQFLYSKANKMQWGRGAIGGTLMTFKTYSVAYLELLHRMWTQGGPEGKRATMLALAMLMLMGGAGGLPFEEDLEDAVDALAQMMGYNFSTKKARQEFLESFLPRGLAQFIDKGVSGLPGAPLDVSGRLGMGNLIPGTGLLLEKTSHARDVLEIAGPAGDFASRILSGSKNILTGNVGSGLLEMSPAAVRNAAKGADMAATGMYRDAKGYKVLDTNTLEAALKAIGFQPASVATVQEANSINQGAKAFYSMRAQEIRAQWAQGIFEGDQAKVQEARDAVADWNHKNPDQPMLIRIPDVMHRVREMRKSKDQRIADTAPKAMRAQMREDFARTRAALVE